MHDFEQWYKNIKEYYPQADKTVLKFIHDFLNMQNTSNKITSAETEQIIYNQFAHGYCYYFAHMLKLAFNRGEICWAAPFGHIVWLDDNDIAYDISGVNDSEIDYYIPIFMLGDMIKDFKHVPNDAYNASDQEIAQAILEWENIIHTDNKSCNPEDTDVINMSRIEGTNYINQNKDNDNEIVKAKIKYLILKFK